MTETSFHNMSVSFWYTFTSFGYVHGSGLFRNPIDCSLFQDGHFFTNFMKIHPELFE